MLYKLRFSKLHQSNPNVVGHNQRTSASRSEFDACNAAKNSIRLWHLTGFSPYGSEGLPLRQGGRGAPVRRVWTKNESCCAAAGRRAMDETSQRLCAAKAASGRTTGCQALSNTDISL